MKKMGSLLGLKIGLMIFCAMVAMSAAAFAEDAKPAAPLVSADDIKKALGMSIYLQSGYTYNGNASTGQINDLRAFDTKANSFGLDLLELGFAKDPAAGVIGYKVKISAGNTATDNKRGGFRRPDTGFHRRYRGLCKLHCPGRQGASVRCRKDGHLHRRRSDGSDRQPQLLPFVPVHLG